MGLIDEAVASLKVAIDTVDGLRAVTNPSASLNPPAVVIGPPALQWGGVCTGPTKATFVIYVVVPFDERALERLWDYVLLVSDAVDATENAVVVRADPGTFINGAREYPSYELTTEVAL